MLRRQYVLLRGKPVEVRVTDKRRERVPFLANARRDYLYFTGGKEPVGSVGFRAAKVGETRAARELNGTVYLDDDSGYSRFKLWLFGLSFAALWAWAAARYRFG